MNAKQMKHAANLAEWKDRIIACRASGLSVKAWCEQNYWNTSTYYRWEREIFGRVRKSTPTEPEAEASGEALMPICGQALVELPVAEPQSSSTGLAGTPVFRPVAVVRVGDMELSLTNAVSPKLMKQLKELIPHAE